MHDSHSDGCVSHCGVMSAQRTGRAQPAGLPLPVRAGAGRVRRDGHSRRRRGIQGAGSGALCHLNSKALTVLVPQQKLCLRARVGLGMGRGQGGHLRARPQARGERLQHAPLQPRQAHTDLQPVHRLRVAPAPRLRARAWALTLPTGAASSRWRVGAGRAAPPPRARGAVLVHSRRGDAAPLHTDARGAEQPQPALLQQGAA